MVCKPPSDLVPDTVLKGVCGVPGLAVAVVAQLRLEICPIDKVLLILLCGAKGPTLAEHRPRQL